ncbi:CLUMA_CG006790, isoform A [Clunio marinus]|uniref:CLUMA_CG006790, isoform A n=1 Tax=Clunio marinus TaxID=568069 RepID=A0A1J1HYR8_9DIPT|nr:CLUMA_CG006790, isoform A [Clunio marinus]
MKHSILKVVFVLVLLWAQLVVSAPSLPQNDSGGVSSLKVKSSCQLYPIKSEWIIMDFKR